MKIPDFVQVLNKVNVPDDIRNTLIKVYKSGGIKVDENMLKNNPNAKDKILFVSAVVKDKKKFSPKDNNVNGYWIYCGNGYYVRKVNNKYEISAYLVYSTKDKKCIGKWDNEKYKC